MELLSEVNSHANLITAVATAVLAILTGILLSENRSLRRAGSAPEVIAYLLPHPDGNGGIHFVLANVGRGPAFNVSFRLEYDEADFREHQVLLENDPERTTISVLPQDEKVRALLGISFRLYGNLEDRRIDPLLPFKVHTTFTDVFGRKMQRTRELDIKQFAGLRGVLEKSNERKTSQSLANIEQHMASIARQCSRFSGFVDVTEMSDMLVRKAKSGTE